MFYYNKKLLELEHITYLSISVCITNIIPHPIKQIQNILIQDKNFILASS